LEKFRATVIKVTELMPMPGMSKGVALIVKESADDPESITVHICPSWYMSKKEIGIKKGDRLKIRGSWAEIDGKDVFMAAKIKRGEYFELKLRLTKDGSSFWTMSPEELAREKKAP
jgi:ribosomal protein L11